MTEGRASRGTTRIEPTDATAGFSSGVHTIDDYFARHAVPNDTVGVNRAYVLRRRAEDEATLPPILGFYTLSMANEESSVLEKVLGRKLPKYPSPVALIGRLAVDQRVQRRGVGEVLLVDALRRIQQAADVVGCVGTIVDAKNESAARFYAKYGFVDVEGDGCWPQRLFLSLRRTPNHTMLPEE